MTKSEHSRSPFGPPILVVAWICGGSCSYRADDGSVPSVTRRDSAGITIVESAAPQWGDSAHWTVDAEPIVELTTSGTGPPHEFVSIWDAIRLTDGSLVVADRGAHQVRIFSSRGVPVTTVGRDGDGPGEFRRLIRIDRFRGDSLVAFDYWVNRITVLTPDWEVARVISPPVFDRRTQELHVLDDSTFVTMPYLSNPPPPEGGRYRILQAVMRLSSTQDVLDTIATAVPGFETYDHQGGSTDPLFARDGHLDVHAGRIYVGSAEQMRYDVVTPNGRLERIVRVPDFDLSLSAAEIRAEREERIALLPEGPQFILDRVTTALNDMPVPHTRPAYSDLIVDAEACVWAIEFHAVSERDQPTEAQIFDADGAWLGAVELPPRFTVFEIGEDYVLGKFTDALDVEHPQLLRLRREHP